MSSGLNVNNYSGMPAISKNTALKSFNNAQNVSFRAQYESGQDVYGAQNSKPKSGKTFWVIFTLATGAALAAIAYHYRGKTPSAKEGTKAAEAAVTAVSETAAKTEDVQSTSDKNSLIKMLKDKFKSIGEDIKQGFEEHKPTPDVPCPKTANQFGLGEKITGTLNGFNKGIPLVEEMSDDARKFVNSNCKINDDVADVLNNNKTRYWVRKIVNDFSNNTSSSVEYTGIGKICKIGKKNAFIRTGTDSWIYAEGYSDSLRKTTSKAKRRITVNNDEITVVLDNVKYNKENFETAKKRFIYNTITGDTKYFTDYKLTQNSVEFSKGFTVSQGSTIPSEYIEKYEELSDGTIKAKKLVNLDSMGNRVYSENVVKFADGSEECTKVAKQNPFSGEILSSIAGYKQHNGIIEYAKELDLVSNACKEKVKIMPDGTETVAKITSFDSDKKLLSCEQGVKIKSSGNRKADIRVEYKPGTNEPKFYYEDYKYDAATDTVTYGLKAKFKKGKWIKVG